MRFLLIVARASVLALFAARATQGGHRGPPLRISGDKRCRDNRRGSHIALGWDRQLRANGVTRALYETKADGGVAQHRRGRAAGDYADRIIARRVENLRTC